MVAALIIGAFLLDCIIGDPQNPLHPIRFIGSGIMLGIKAYKRKRPKSDAAQFILGMMLSIAVILSAYLITFWLTRLAYRAAYIFGLFFEIIVCYFTIAPKALKDESMKVCNALGADDIPQARIYLSYIVGRDTANLGTSELVLGAVETVAENLSDGVIAPLLFMFIGGAPLAMAYKAVNTLDSMIGYKNEDYMFFGRFAARFDDAVNFIPARISAYLMIFACKITGMSSKEAARIYKRDKYNH